MTTNIENLKLFMIEFSLCVEMHPVDYVQCDCFAAETADEAVALLTAEMTEEGEQFYVRDVYEC